ncbi:hypothetical protein GCM10011517_28960 [Actibacterium pelagium]|uniref:Uncharacterized protein n=1 Tax=Actibacterium pelagium TaxID=2029103 RepID=A0A917EN78_9RHOB|nr:hypothetical protein GCM10011517_28960 [Actibacterium pelagium]
MDIRFAMAFAKVWFAFPEISFGSVSVGMAALPAINDRFVTLTPSRNPIAS